MQSAADNADVFEQIVELKKLANAALAAAGREDAQTFVDSTEAYLTALEQWQQQTANRKASLSDGLDENRTVQLRAALEELQTLHRRLLEKAALTKDEVGEQLGDVHRRAQGLKRYLDVYPSRVTITGRRKG